MPRKRYWVTFLLFSTMLFLLANCGWPEVYTAYVDRIEPPVPGLEVKGLGVGGDLYITNNSGQVVYLYDQKGQELYKMTPTQLFKKDLQGSWVLSREVSETSYAEVNYEGSRDNQPKGIFQGQVMKRWVVEGRVGDTPFKIYGHTAYGYPKE
jgi:hypothetical protein